MTIDEFKQDFLNETKTTAQADGIGSTAAMVQSFMNYWQEYDYLREAEAAFYEGIGQRNRKLRVDGYAYDELDQSMSLLIADYDLDTERTLTRTDADNLQTRLRYFVEEALDNAIQVDISLPAADLLDWLRQKRDDIRQYRLYIISNANISKTFKTLETPEIDGKPTACHVWDIERLFGLVSKRDDEALEIDFAAHCAGGIPCLQASEADTDNIQSYLCVIPATVLADIYDQHGSALLEGNVRSFLSTKVAVNKKIRQTILKEPRKFFAYNNGISATAMSINLNDERNHLVRATDFQIINGGQTTASLSNARYKDKADLSQIFVPMKLTVINSRLNDEAANEWVQNISRSSNSQNKVSDADFFAAHPFHMAMEKYSQRLLAHGKNGQQYDTHWFYERARGQYLQKQMRMTATEKKKFLLENPKNQLITKTDLAKIRNSWGGLPHIVSKGAQTNFNAFADTIGKEWGEDGVRFGGQYFKESVALCLLFQYLEARIPHLPWYQSGYRANIVTYTIALFHHLLQQQFPASNLDLERIWREQRLSEHIRYAVKELAYHVYQKLTDPNRAVENVTQWCKREACWQQVQAIDYTLPSAMTECLISEIAYKQLAKEANKERQLDIKVDAQTDVLNTKAEEWLRIFKVAQQHHLIDSPSEESALRIACQIPHKLPNDRQAKQLLSLRQRLIDEGIDW
ncbi:AIPR family protein [Stenoxybacter acetivorans]|uniref:AIPR family protein n=1 Tax=Stenoxybacter acetivorans TaxID=422441 RepID=UPI000565701E|nr:AIPR family protein [Stenoxybacter acetivorans]